MKCVYLRRKWAILNYKKKNDLDSLDVLLRNEGLFEIVKYS